MFVRSSSANVRPSVLFGAKCSSTSFEDGYLCARKTIYGYPPSRQDFDDQLSWAREPTRFLSFGTWRRALQRRRQLESDGKRDIVVIAVWAENLEDVYSAEEAASKLGYSDMGLDPARKLWHHCKEYLVDGGIPADEYRVLAVFEGGGPQRNVVLVCPLYQISTPIPSGFFQNPKSNNALQDIEDEIYNHMQIISHFCSRSKSRTCGTDGWKKIVLCVIADGRKNVHPRTVNALAALGIYRVGGITKNVVNQTQVNAHVEGELRCGSGMDTLEERRIAENLSAVLFAT